MKPVGHGHVDDDTLKPKPPVRRATLDLIGLPPTPAEVDAFLFDTSPKAFAKVVDRLLASPHYGERWARHWLDVARFAESSGFEHDYDREGAYQFRDFVAAGGLMSYGANWKDVFRKGGAYVGQILKGTKPGDLPFHCWNAARPRVRHSHFSWAIS